MPLDPISGAIGGLQTLFGIGQSIFSGRKKAERNLNKQIDNAPKTAANKSILDFYNTALSRYNVDPTSSALYKRSQNNIGRNQATALSGLQDRRGGLAGASSILRASNDASLNANVAAEQERNQRFNVLGGATTMKSNEDERVFEQNEMLPFNLRTQLKAQQLQGANQRANAGTQNIFGGAQTLLSGYTPKAKKTNYSTGYTL